MVVIATDKNAGENYTSRHDKRNSTVHTTHTYSSIERQCFGFSSIASLSIKSKLIPLHRTVKIKSCWAPLIKILCASKTKTDLLLGDDEFSLTPFLSCASNFIRRFTFAKYRCLCFTAWECKKGG